MSFPTFAGRQEREAERRYKRVEALRSAEPDAAPALKSAGAALGGSFSFGTIGVMSGAADRGRASALDVALEGFTDSPRPVPHRGEMESLFGHHFGDVEVFTGPAAKSANHRLRSDAYTVGRRVAFAHPSPPPPLVAHELGHVIEQTGGLGGGHRAPSSDGIDRSNEAFAEEAEFAAASPTPMRLNSSLSTAYSPRLQLKEAGDAEGGFFGKKVPSQPRFSRVATTEGSGETFEVQLDVSRFPAKIPFPGFPLLSLQIIPEIRLLCRRGRLNAAPTLTLYSATFSGRLIGIATLGQLNLVEAFASLTGFFEGTGTVTVENREPVYIGSRDDQNPVSSVAGEVTLRGAARAGVRALRRFLEWSYETKAIQIFKLAAQVKKTPTGLQFEALEQGFQWGPDIVYLGRLIATKIDEAKKYEARQLARLDWVQSAARKPIDILTEIGGAGLSVLEGGIAIGSAIGDRLAGGVENIRDRLEPDN